MYRISYKKKAEARLVYYRRHDPASYRKVTKLIEELKLHPRTGTGQPEQLRHCAEPIWSRRINKKDRLLYEINDDIVLVSVISVGGHYDDK